MVKRLIILVIILSVIGGAAAQHKSIKMGDVKALTLKKGEFTTGKRSTPVMQLQCHGSFCNHAPDVVQCLNVGFDGNSVQWECKADLPEWLSFKDSDVNCEGYEYPTDPYILVGSCGMSYRLKGSPPFSGPDSIGETVPGLGGLLIIGMLLLCCCSGTNRYRPYPYYGRSYYGGGGNTATAAAVGAAAGYAAGRSSGGWGWGRSRSSRSGRSFWGRSSSRGGGRRTATTFSGTSRR